MLKLVRPISDIHELYSEYSEYRFAMLEDRFRAAHEKMSKFRDDPQSFSVVETKRFIREQIEFLEQMDKEIIHHEGGKKHVVG